MSFTLADTLWSAEATVQTIASAGVVLAAFIAAYVPLSRRLRGIGRDVTQAREQVKNDHGTNLRDDVDAIGATAHRALEAAEKSRDLAVSNQAAIVALAAEVRHLGVRRRPWWRR